MESKHFWRLPPEVVSAGVIIKKLRDQNPDNGFTYIEFLKKLDVGKIPDEFQRPAPAIKMLAKNLASDNPWMNNVFTILATCPLEPVPMGLFGRLLPDTLCEELQQIRECPLLTVSRDEPDVGRKYTPQKDLIMFHHRTHEIFKRHILGQLPADPRHREDVLTERVRVISQFVNGLLQEYEETKEAGLLPSKYSQRLVRLLEGFLQRSRAYMNSPTDIEVGICCTLSDVYLELEGRPDESLGVMKDFMEEVLDTEVGMTGHYIGHSRETVKLKPLQRAKLTFQLGKTYRHLGEYQKAVHSLSRALKGHEHVYGESSPEFAVVLKEIASTLLEYGSFDLSRGHFMDALGVFEKQGCNQNPLVVAEINSLLGLISSHVGEWDLGKVYCSNALSLVKEQPPSLKMAEVYENIAKVYSAQGNYKEGRNYFQTAVDMRHKLQGPNLIAASSQAKIAICDRYIAPAAAMFWYSNRFATKMQEVLEKTADIPWMYNEAFLALASSACDFRDVNQIKQLLTQAYSRGIQGPLPQEAQIQLGRMLRWSGDLQNSQKNLEELIHRNLLNGKGAPDRLLFSRYRINVPFPAHKGLLVLGKVYDASGCILQCLEAIKQARILHNEFCGKNNPEGLSIKVHHASILYQAGDCKTSLELINEAIGAYQVDPRVCELQSTPIHLEYAEALTLHGKLLYQEGKLDDSRMQLLKADTIYKRLLKGNNIQKAVTLSILGATEYRLGNHKTGVKLLDGAFSMGGKAGAKHYLLAPIAMYYAQVLLKEGKHKKARILTEQAIQLLEDTCRYNVSSQLAECHVIMAHSSEGQNNMAAVEHQKVARTIYKQLIERERKLCADSGLDLMRTTYVQDWTKQLQALM